MRKALMVAFVGCLGALWSSPVSAHPLGTLSWNTHAAISVSVDKVSIAYVLDIAEVPTLQVEKSLNGSTLDAWAEQECSVAAGQIDVSFAGEPVKLTSMFGRTELTRGQGGLDILRVECELTGPVASVNGHFSFSDRYNTDRVGWREVTLVGSEVAVSDTALPLTSSSNELRAYPGGKNLRVLEGSAELRDASTPGLTTGSVAPVTTTTRSTSSGLSGKLSDVLSAESLGFSAALVALLIAYVLGALHSLAPGHGKSLMAAIVAGRRGTLRDVLTVAVVVAVTHTGGVLLLGAVLWSSGSFAPETVLPWLTALSGGLLVLMGAMLARRVFTGRGWGGHAHHHLDGTHGHGHSHGHGHHDHHDHHDHDHDDHDHADHHHDDHDHADHDHADHDHAATHVEQSQEGVLAERLSWRWLVGMGVAGGVVPTPSALVVLLGAIAIDRLWFGVLLVGMYGIGMASTLLGAGFLLVRLEKWLERVLFNRRGWGVFLRFAPLGSACVLCASGVLIIASAL